MILADLFKPNKYGTPAYVVTLSGALLKIQGNKAVYQPSTFVERGFTLNSKVQYIEHKGTYLINTDQGGQETLQVLYLNPATAENLLVAKTLEHI